MRARSIPPGQPLRRVDIDTAKFIQGGTVKRVIPGLVGLTLAASLGLAYAYPGTAAPAPPTNAKDQPTKVGKDELPNPLEEKRRALREAGITSVLNGDATAVQKNGA